MRSLTTLACFLVSSLLWTPVQGQETTQSADNPPASQPAEEASGRQAFFAVLEQLSRALAGSDGYQLQVENVWVARSGDSETTGKNDLRLLVAGPNQIRLDVLSGDVAQPQLIAVANGEQVVHWFAPERIYSVQAQTDPRRQIRGCQLTADTLAMCGADFLVNPDLLESTRGQLIHATDWGVEDGLHRFHLEMINGREIDIWFQDDPKLPLPMKLESRMGVAINETSRRDVMWSTQFNWKLGNVPPADAFVLQLPEGARQVSSLSEAIMGQNANTLVGQSVPPLELTGLDGNAAGWQEAGKPTLLYFWATWAAPSVREMPGIQEFAAGLKEMGVAVRAVNVAEPADQVAAFVKEIGYDGALLLDTEGAAAGKLRLVELPAVVLIGPNGVVQAVFQKADPSIRPEIRSALEKMMNPQR